MSELLKLRNMRNNNIILSVATALLLMLTVACNENEVLPDHSVVGEAYATVVEFTASNPEPTVGETIEITLSYVNYGEDPLQSLTFFKQEDGGERTMISTIDETGAPIDKQVERSFSYEVPAAAEVTIYVELKSAKEYPQVEKLDLEVQ